MVDFKFDGEAWIAHHEGENSDNELTQYVGPLDENGEFEAPEIKKKCGGKVVHFYVTPLAPPSDSSCIDTGDPVVQPWPAPPSSTTTTNQWISILKCSHEGQKKKATVTTCDKNEHSVDTNINGSTTFTWTIKSINGAVDAGVVLVCTTKSTS